MLFSRNWIADYVALPDEAEEVARRLTEAGLAVEDVATVTLADGSEDVVFEVDVTANRVDAMNHLGLAREAAVLFGRELKPPAVEIREAAEAAADVARVAVDDFGLCPRLTALAIRGVQVGPSPAWLTRRLEAIGQRSINNIVDVTNFVLWETGQPLHAYDLDRLTGAEIRARRARHGEELITLDGELRKLTPEVLVIADAAQPVGVAGVMGGRDSEVGEATSNVLLESAHFDPRTVRRGARQLAMHTDASHRFERGADPEGCVAAARRAAALMVEVAGGEVLAGVLEEKRLRSDWPPRVTVDLGRLNRFGGTEITAAEVERTLTGLGFELAPEDENRWQVTVPPWRYYDFENAYPADVYEEVLRVHGLDSVAATLPQLAGADAPESPEHRRRRQIQDLLETCGFTEAIDYAFHDRASDAAYPTLYEGREALELDNPLSDRYTVMRRSLLPNLVESARYNQRRGATAVRLFEIGNVFCAGGGADGHDEQEALAVVVGGRLGTPWERPLEVDFFDLKGILEAVAEGLGIRFDLRPAEVRKMVAGTAAEVRLAGDGRAVGYAGQLDDGDSPYPLFVAELALAELSAEVGFEARLPSRYPGIAVDSTLTHALDVPWSEIARAVIEISAEDLVDFGLKDRYHGSGVPEGCVNTTLYFLYNSAERSLTQEEVNERHGRLAGELQRRFSPGAP